MGHPSSFPLTKFILNIVEGLRVNWLKMTGVGLDSELTTNGPGESAIQDRPRPLLKGEERKL